MELSKRVEQLAPSGIRAFFDLVMGMKDVISLGVGEPDFVTPWKIREKAIYSLDLHFEQRHARTAQGDRDLFVE
jgi:aminotransferase